MIKGQTKGTWFVAYGCVYSQLGDGTVVRIALMDRDEKGTIPTERDTNAHYIAHLQNTNVGRKLTEENHILALEELEERLR